MALQGSSDLTVNVIHDLARHDLEHSIVHINNGHVTNRQEGRTFKVVLETLHKDPASLKDHLGYLTRTSNGKILKSSTIYIRNEEGDSIDYLLSINYDITGLMTVDRSIKSSHRYRTPSGREAAARTDCPQCQ